MEEPTERKVKQVRKVGRSRIFEVAFNDAVRQKSGKSQMKTPVTLGNGETQNSEKAIKQQHELSSALTETTCRKRFSETAPNDKSLKNLYDQGFNVQRNSDRHGNRTVDKHHSNFKRSSYNNSNQHNGSFHKLNSISGHDLDYQDKSNNAKPDTKSHFDNVRRNFEIDKNNSYLKRPSSYSDYSTQSGSFNRQSSNLDYRDSKTNSFKPNYKSHPYKHKNPNYKQYSDDHDDRWENNDLNYGNGQYSDNNDSKLHGNRPNGQNTHFGPHSDIRNKSNNNFERQSSFRRQSSDDHSDKFNKSTRKQISDSTDHSGDPYDDSSNDHNMQNSKSGRDSSKNAEKSGQDLEIHSKSFCLNHEDPFSQSNVAGREFDCALNSKSQDEDLAVSDSPFEVVCASDVQDEESVNTIEYCGNKNQRSFDYSENIIEHTSSNTIRNIRISVKNDLIELNQPVVSKTDVPSCTDDVSSSSLLMAASTDLPVIASTSTASNSDTSLQICSDESLPLSYGTSDESSYSAFETICNSIPSSPEDFIPPPVMNAAVSGEDETTFQDREDQTSKSSISSESDEYCCLPDSAHLEAISNFITKVKKKKTAKSAVAIDVVRDLNRLFKDHLEGNIIEVYGSYDCDLAITTSDINLVMKTEVPPRKSFMFEVYKVMKNELPNYHIIPYEEGTSVHQSKINFSHPTTGVSCQLAYLGRYQENVFKMVKFLKEVCLRDPRVKTLILTAKIWAEHLRINEVEEGKLHSIGFVLLVIHFLQHCENPVLPVYNCSNQVPETFLPNESSVGELWLSFLKYYSVTFNWQKDVVTVNSKEYVSKKSKHWENYWIAIEDPFSGKNVAEKVVNCDVADYIKACFRSSFEHFMSPPIITSTDHDDEEASELEFSFDQCIVDQTDSFCQVCDEIDDVCEDCKKKYYVKPMTTLPKMTDSFLKKVKEALFIIYEKYILSDEDVEERKNFVNELQKEVCKVYPQARLNLFGSSTNGFGFKKSDLDICMTFKDEKEMDSDVIFTELRKIFRRNKTKFENVFAIFDAKIPVLKFRYKPKGWLCDISFNNTLAVHNSELLYTYSLIDKRCKILGCALKLIAKKAHIAEVTDKALSSYSYLNMVIHFLQQTEPPVLPVLQDSKYRGQNYELDHIVNKCNVWFCKDLDYIKEVFKSENDTPVEQLFLDLLDYYCSYDCNLLISIRQKEIRPLGEHRAARLFNIQDPFIETKNLGCVVSASKAQETKSVFNRARQLFRTPIKELPTGVNDIEDYFFSSMSLTGRIQKEVLCDKCNKFGHEQKDCNHFKWQNNYLNRPFKYQNSYTKRSAMHRKPSRSNFLGKK